MNPLATVSIVHEERGVVATVKGELDISNTDDVGKQLRTAASFGGPVRLDLVGLTYLDSSGLRLLDQLRGDLETAGLALVVAVAAGSVVQRLLQITCLDQSIDLAVLEVGSSGA